MLLGPSGCGKSTGLRTIVGPRQASRRWYHVHSTGEIGAFEVVKTESKGKDNKRIGVRVHD